jgi:hypothetical protein
MLHAREDMPGQQRDAAMLCSDAYAYGGHGYAVLRHLFSLQ